MISPARIRNRITRLGGLWLALVACALVACALVACAGPRTSVELDWTAPNAQSAQLHRVVTLFVSRDVALRRPAEDEMARQLAERGVEARPAYQLLSRDDLSNLNAAKAKLRGMGYDSVVTMRLVGEEQTLNYVPPSFDAYWTWASPYFFWPGYYAPGYYAPGYVYTTTIVRMETEAYSLADDRLVWAALSRTTDPGNARELIENVTRTVATKLTDQGLAA
jgi:hypothetical protein